MEGIWLLLGFAVFLGIVFGWISIFRVSSLSRELRALRRELEALTHTVSHGSVYNKRTEKAEEGVADQKPAQPEPSTPIVAEKLAPESDSEQASQPRPQSIPETRQESSSFGTSKPAEPAISSQALEGFRSNWMVWLGGICVALAGIFLVKYSIDIGLLSPAVRIALALSGGVVLHAVADWLRRKTGRADRSFAALAGGASIVLYAALLAGLHLYGLLNPNLVFILLAAVSLGTTWLSMIYGPVMAILGILGAFIVPILIGAEDGNILIALGYALVITVSGLVLMRYVYRGWLFLGLVVGAGAWWGISLTDSLADGFRGLYLTALLYACMAIPVSDWFLAGKKKYAESWLYLGLTKDFNITPAAIAAVLTTLAVPVSISSEPFSNLTFWVWLPTILMVFQVSRCDTKLQFAPWLLMLPIYAVWFLNGAYSNGPIYPEQLFIIYTISTALLFSACSGWVSWQDGYSNLYVSLATLALPLGLGLAYMVVTNHSPNWYWGAVTLVQALAYVAFSGVRLQKHPQDGLGFWLVLSGHLGYSFAVMMLFREAGLTLALALQIISLTVLSNRFKLVNMTMFIKILVSVVVVRLTLNPAIAHYPEGLHWSLWTYGGSALCCYLAALQCRQQQDVKSWLVAASIHLFVLFLGAETRYWLYDGQIFSSEYSFTEAGINTSLWTALGFSYYYRSGVATSLRKLYTYASRILLTLAVGNYFVSLLLLNPLWSNESVTGTPIFNMLLLTYGMPPLLAYLMYKWYDQTYRRVAAYLCGGGVIVFLTLQVRHLIHGGLDISDLTSDAELYTYSAVWLATAVVLLVLAIHREWRQMYLSGMALLMAVILKIFTVDMSDLEGLYRVGSFMALGICLLGIAYFHQRIERRNAETQPES